MKIEVIGRGNVGSQFARIFGVTPIPPRTLEGLSEDADLYIIAVSDDAVADVVAKMPKVKGIVAHTSGSVSIDELNQMECGGYGVLYPFQTISKSRPLKASDIPLLVEANNGETAEFIISTAKQYGFDKIQIADSQKRGIVHLSGTIACNFTNAMIAISQKVLKEAGIESDIVNPLISETFEKIKQIPAKEAQTGPAVRRDISTMMKHERLLKNLEMGYEADIYAIISEYIVNNS